MSIDIFIHIDLAIPSSFTTNLSSNMQRSFAVSLVSRAAAIFGVDKIYIYPDPLNQDRQTSREVQKLLSYLITPPYLKKSLFHKDKTLGYVGALPPVKLNIFKEKVMIRDMVFPDYRVGMLIGRSKGGSYLYDVGLDKLVAVKSDVKPRSTALVKIVKNSEKYLIGEIVSERESDELKLYSGYRVIRLKESLPTFLRRYRGVKIGLSRYGSYVGDIDVHMLKRMIVERGRYILVFGAPDYGLVDILNYYGLTPEDIFDYFLNLVYHQNVETIRIEEAVIMGLSILDFIYNAGRFER